MSSSRARFPCCTLAYEVKLDVDHSLVRHPSTTDGCAGALPARVVVDASGQNREETYNHVVISGLALTTLPFMSFWMVCTARNWNHKCS
ncbi:hypothetical protein BD311DRAFT_764086 [Dichomitus squalens]|uniref:Uncharacterized protein n=1 Tax=Dichomitus squalens TaxID=114155 RepID=A0A4Q9MEF3_9APHY|nr:hypothetical protein BD311DRAFT_764086 [Dichomitus squalens]